MSRFATLDSLKKAAEKNSAAPPPGDDSDDDKGPGKGKGPTEWFVGGGGVGGSSQAVMDPKKAGNKGANGGAGGGADIVDRIMGRASRGEGGEARSGEFAARASAREQVRAQTALFSSFPFFLVAAPSFFFFLVFQRRARTSS